jgi:hypothetical protein
MIASWQTTEKSAFITLDVVGLGCPFGQPNFLIG